MVKFIILPHILHSLLILSVVESLSPASRIDSHRYCNNCSIFAIRQQQQSLPLSMINSSCYSRIITTSPYLITALKATENDESTTGTKENDKLSSLGYTDEEIQRSKNREFRQQQKEQLSVRVNLLPDIDSVTLTAIGFGLIAFNFFVLGNLEDGGIAGVVATIINTLSQ